MFLVIFIAVIIFASVWWFNSNRAMSLNEKLYLRRRGYDPGEPLQPRQPVSGDARLFSLIESLRDISPFARQRAAEGLTRMCEEGRRDPRMFSSLVNALDDNDASVRGAVAIALASLGDLRAIEPLKFRQEIEESIHVRALVMHALERLRPIDG